MVEIRVLGELEVIGDAGPVPVRALKHRQLLAALVISGGEACTTDALIDALWGERPPASGPKLLHVYVSQLRGLLPTPAAIRTMGQSYALELDTASLDTSRFERLLVEGQEALEGRNPALAGSLLRRALGLWRGRAYGSLAYMEFVRADAERLEELRRVALEARIEADLAAGREAEVIGELQSLAAAQPLRERVQAQLMLCLYRCGRHAEALEVFTTLRASLRDELGLEPGDELRELQRRILQHDPGLAIASAVVPRFGELPTPPNPLLGRDRELQELRDLLARDDVRLLVLSGAGGSGKTRLALDAALRSASKFANGVAFVALAPLRDPALVVGAIARALGLEEQIGDPLARLAAFLRPLELLLVVDNAEHLRAAAPAFVELLAGAPRLKVLITSRVVLHLSGEHVYPVGPLDERAAVELFCARARAAEASFVLDESNRQVIERICQRLDGLPLAIELAASRARILTPAELLPRLEPRLPLLIGGPRDLPARQQTMRATIAWSHELLDEDEQRDFRRLAIFAGGCTPQAAEAICGSVFERLWALADHNLLRRVVSAGGSRFQMLETVREYAAERLEGSGELDQTSRRHAGFYLALAEAANLHADAEGPQDFDTVHVEQDNLHAAIAWALGAGEIELALGLTVALENFWVTHDPGEGMRLFGLALESGATFPPELRARALRALGGSTQVAGNPERAMRLYEQSRELFHSLGDKKGTAVLDYRLGRNALELGDLTRAQALLSASLEAFRAAGSRRGEAQAVGSLGELARSQGERELAAGLFEQSAAMCERIGRKWWQARMLANLADLALEQGRIKDAANRGRELLPLAQRIGDRQGVLHALACLACVAADDGRAEHAGRLWGALEAEHARHPVAAWSRDRERYATWLLAQPHHDLQNGIQEGRLLALQTAVEEALADDTVSAPPAASRG